jgi:predicted HTH transcriptional regulator
VRKLNNPKDVKVVKEKIESGEVKVKGHTAERRKFTIAGREFWLTKKEMRKEFPDHSSEEQVELWESAEKEVKPQVVKPTPEEKKERKKSPEDEVFFNALVEAYAKKKEAVTSGDIAAITGTKRSPVRRAMARLIGQGNVEGIAPTESKRIKLLYKPKEA